MQHAPSHRPTEPKLQHRWTHPVPPAQVESHTDSTTYHVVPAGPRGATSSLPTLQFSLHHPLPPRDTWRGRWTGKQPRAVAPEVRFRKSGELMDEEMEVVTAMMGLASGVVSR